MTTFTTDDRIEATKPPKLPKAGSIWAGTDMEKFRVIEVVPVDNSTWVHYIGVKTGKEYSCYVESFLARFRELPE
jgi:hypothetical protein